MTISILIHVITKVLTIGRIKTSPAVASTHICFMWFTSIEENILNQNPLQLSTINEWIIITYGICCMMIIMFSPCFEFRSEKKSL